MEEVAEAMQRMMSMLLELELLRQGTANTAMQSQLNALSAGELRDSKDRKWTREDLESQGDGTASKWRDWKVVTSSYTGACHEGRARLMTKAEETENPVINATRVKNEGA